jgi:hypothetical protein
MISLLRVAKSLGLSTASIIPSQKLEKPRLTRVINTMLHLSLHQRTYVCSPTVAGVWRDIRRHEDAFYSEHGVLEDIADGVSCSSASITPRVRLFNLAETWFHSMTT